MPTVEEMRPEAHNARRVTTRLTTTNWEWLCREAPRQYRSRSSLLEMLLNRAVDEARERMGETRR